MKEDKITILYHDDLDGQCAAAVTAMSFKYQVESMIAINHNDIDIYDNLIDEDLIFVDFCPKTEFIAQLLRNNCNVLIIDHHITARNRVEEIESLPEANADNLKMYFDTTHAGCRCAWDFFFGITYIPETIDLVEDYDIWKWELKSTADFVAGMQIADVHDFTEGGLWSRLLSRFNGDVANLLSSICEQGYTIRLYQEAYHRRVMEYCAHIVEFEGYEVLACDCPCTNSKLFGNDFANYPMVIGYEFNGAEYVVSLYSHCPDGKTPLVNVSEIAVKHGGGGHPGAAGFSCRTLPWKILRRLGGTR